MANPLNIWNLSFLKSRNFRLYRRVLSWGQKEWKMTNGPIDKAGKAQNVDILDAFKAPFAERERQPETQQNGLILFSFGRNGGFGKANDQSKEGVSVA